MPSETIEPPGQVLRDTTRSGLRASGPKRITKQLSKREMSRLQKALGDEARTYAKAQSFDVVLSTEGVVYAAPAFDITPAVLAALQARNAASPATAPPAGKPAPPPAKPQTH